MNKTAASGTGEKNAAIEIRKPCKKKEKNFQNKTGRSFACTRRNGALEDKKQRFGAA